MSANRQVGLANRRLQVCIQEVSGHPLLVPAAINAAKQWEYKPFVVDGQAVNISTVIEIPFSLGISEADSRLEQQNNDAYFRSEGDAGNYFGRKASS